jgi:hypothetical protein
MSPPSDIPHYPAPDLHGPGPELVAEVIDGVPEDVFGLALWQAQVEG